MDKFYKITELSIDEKISIINEAYRVSISWRVDKLDCSISWARQKIDMSFEDVMKKFGNGCHFVVIHRSSIIDGEYGEIGFSTMTGISYYLWIYTDIKQFEIIVEKYGLEVVS